MKHWFVYVFVFCYCYVYGECNKDRTIALIEEKINISAELFDLEKITIVDSSIVFYDFNKDGVTDMYFQYVENNFFYKSFVVSNDSSFKVSHVSRGGSVLCIDLIFIDSTETWWLEVKCNRDKSAFKEEVSFFEGELVNKVEEDLITASDIEKVRYKLIANDSTVRGELKITEKYFSYENFRGERNLEEVYFTDSLRFYEVRRLIDVLNFENLSDQKYMYTSSHPNRLVLEVELKDGRVISKFIGNTANTSYSLRIICHYLETSFQEVFYFEHW